MRICKLWTEKLCFAVHHGESKLREHSSCHRPQSSFSITSRPKHFLSSLRATAMNKFLLGSLPDVSSQTQQLIPNFYFSYKLPQEPQYLSGLLHSAVFRGWFPLFQLSQKSTLDRDLLLQNTISAGFLFVSDKSPTPNIQKMPYGFLHNRKIIKYIVLLLLILLLLLALEVFISVFFLFTTQGSRQKQYTCAQILGYALFF